MKTILKQNWLYILIIIGLVILSALSVGTFRYGFFTAYDEAYFLLKLQEAYDMSVITGKSQWNLIAVHWFPYLDLTSKVSSYLAASILIWATIMVIATTAAIVYDRTKFLKYLAITYLVYFPFGGGLSYVPMQTAVLAWALCAFVLFHYSRKTWTKALFAAICGVCLGLACFIIIPAALALLLCVAVLIGILYWSDKRRMFTWWAAGICGVLLAVAYMHFVVCDIREVIDAMRFAAGYIGKSGYRYDGLSFLVQYGLFARDCIFVLLAFTGAYFLSTRLNNKYLSALAYIALIGIYYHYQVKPQAYPSMFLSSVVLIPFLFSNRCHITWHTFQNKATWLHLFLFAFPLIAPLGTNCALGGRVACFVAGWLFLFFKREYLYPSENWKRVTVAALLLYCLPLVNVAKAYAQRDDTYHFTRGNKYFAELAIEERQKVYLDRVYDLLEQYDYTPRQSVVFTAVYDYCCLYAFDAVNATNFHQIENFHYFDKTAMLKPDFIFLCKWDSIVVADELRQMPWGWPEDFDVYYVGTPEDESGHVVYNPEMERRKLYCRKRNHIVKPIL